MVYNPDFWTIVYLHMTNDCPNIQGCTPYGSTLKNFYFPQYTYPVHSEWSKTDFKQNSTCEWCTTLIFWPIVYLHMTNHFPNNQGCTPSESTLKSFYFPQYFPMHSEWSKTDFKKNSTCECCTTLIFWPIVYLYMTNHCPNNQGCTPSGNTFEKFYFPQYTQFTQNDLKQILSKT